MSDLGHFSLTVSWLLAVYGCIAGSYAAKTGKHQLTISTRNSIYLATFFLTISLVYLAKLFLAHDYSYAYVWKTSNNDMPAVYLVSAIWGGMDGSLLLWTTIIAFFSAAVCYFNTSIDRRLYAWLLPSLSLSTLFFTSVTLFLTNPFSPTPVNVIPQDGNGLNPLLQNPSMLIHPPLLYLGFTGFMVPFAFSLAALISGRLGENWSRHTRIWTLVAWTFLTAGIILGGNWAYIELGWGGYWAWDPVENASFMPWLTGTAFLHSIMVERYRAMLKVWNVSLAIGTYLLAIFGTFLTRSGVVQSVHAFAETDVGWVFLAYIFVLATISIGLIQYRKSELQSENKLESYFSRETVFLLNNLLLISICASTLWGVLFPLITEAFGSEKQVLGPPYFNAVNSPLFILLIVFMGIGPMISWKKSKAAALKSALLVPSAIFIGTFVLVLIVDRGEFLAAFTFAAITFSFTCIASEFRKARQIHGGSLVKAIRHRPTRFGGLVVHLGVLAMALGILVSSVYKTEKDINLAVGKSQKVGSYILELESVKETDLANYNALTAKINVYSDKSGKLLGALYPESRFYPKSGETTSEVALRISFTEDLYLAFAGWEAGNLALKVFVNPLQLFVWFGAIVMLFGSLVIFSPRLLAEREAESLNLGAKSPASGV